MKERYLWDRSGDIDHEVEQLEQVLSRLRPSRPLQAPPEQIWRAMPWIPQALAACLLLAAAGSLFIPFTPISPVTAWQVLSVDGRAALGQTPARATARLHANQTLRTSANAHVTLEAEDVGRIDIEPSTELHVVESAPSRQMLSLASGTIHALIWAPPRQFIVDTPSSQAIDLGCKYTLTVEPSELAY